MNQHYINQIDAWHKKRVQELVGESGWLNLVGLYWLHEGQNTFGTAAGNEIRFPEGLGPGRIGIFDLRNGKISVKIESGVEVQHDDQNVTQLAIGTDADGEPTILKYGSLQFYVIERDGHFGLRLRDLNSPKVHGFKGIERFNVDQAWQIRAVIDPYSPPKKFIVPTVLGSPGERSSPGALKFQVGGKPYSLDPIGEVTDDRLFVIFADATTGMTTYSGGRYMWIDTPGDDGTTIIDFNKAYNPPCVFTDFAACPLPPEQNKLPVAVTAGEKIYNDQ